MNILCVEPKVFVKETSSLLDLYSESLSVFGQRADIIVFPEFFSKGFYNGFSDPEIADDGISLNWMRGISKKYSAAVVGSVPVQDGNNAYNRMYFISEGRILSHYDKRHVFRGAEAGYFTCGGKRVIVGYGGFRILLQLCYDLRFPVWSRVRNQDYDMVINIAQWPEIRIGVPEILVKARAIENQSYYLFCNSAALIDGEQEGGHSMLADPSGNLVSPLEVKENDIARMLLFDGICSQVVRSVREKFGVLQDADEFGLIM